MSVSEGIAAAFILLMVVVGVGILSSRTAIEKLVALGLLPRFFINLVPLLTLAARALGAVFIGLGLVQIGITTGLLSQEWIARFGFPTLMIAMGLILLALTLKRTHKD